MDGCAEPIGIITGVVSPNPVGSVHTAVISVQLSYAATALEWIGGCHGCLGSWCACFSLDLWLSAMLG